MLKILLILPFVLLISCNDSTTKSFTSKNATNVLSDTAETPSIILPRKEVAGHVIHITNSCAFNYQIDALNQEINLPTPREIDEIKKIMSYSGLPTNFEVYSASVMNAAAIIIDNKRYIIYDPKLFSYVDEKSQTYWTSMSILAHEIGHHLSGHTMTKSKNQQLAELEADKFSGFILYKMGASLEDAIFAMNKMGSEFDSESHPNKYRRIEYIKQGWEEASNQRYKSAIPPPPQNTVSQSIFDYDLLLDSESKEDYKDYLHDEFNNQDFLEIVIIENKKSVYVEALADYPEFEIKEGDRFDVNVSLNWEGEGWCMAKVREFNETITPGRILRVKFVEEGRGTLTSRTITYLQP